MVYKNKSQSKINISVILLFKIELNKIGLNQIESGTSGYNTRGKSYILFSSRFYLAFLEGNRVHAKLLIIYKYTKPNLTISYFYSLKTNNGKYQTKYE